MLTVLLVVVLGITGGPQLGTQPLQDGGLDDRPARLVATLLDPNPDLDPVQPRSESQPQHVVSAPALRQRGLQLAPAGHQADLLPDPPGPVVGLVLAPHFQRPASAVDVLGIFPHGLDAGPEDVHRVSGSDRGPGQVVEHFVELADGGD